MHLAIITIEINKLLIMKHVFLAGAKRFIYRVTKFCRNWRGVLLRLGFSHGHEGRSVDIPDYAM